LASKLKKFLEDFHALREQNRTKGDAADPVLTEFGRLMQQGTNDITSLRERVAILRRYFLLENPDVQVRDAKRSFTAEERAAIWILGKKTCAKCGKALPTVDEMEADHHKQWAHGGITSLQNGRCLCESCNQEERA
jgi:hypothetical protein